MRTRLRMYLVAGVVILAILVCGVAAAPSGPKFDLDQCRNGPANAPVACKDYGGNNGWVNANAGDSQSHFVEGMSIPYRARMTNLPTDRDITVILGYDITQGGAHAIDFLTQYDRLEPHQLDFGHTAEAVFPMDGVTGISTTVSTVTIPAPSSTNPCQSPVTGQPTTSYNNVKTNEGEPKVQMTLFGGTISAIQSAIHYEAEGCLKDANAETTISITFRADKPTAVLAWGGHLASAVDWGSGNSVGGTSGSPYHMTFKSWDLPGGGGEQDRGLAGGAVRPAGSIVIVKDTVPNDPQDFLYSITGVGPVPTTFSLDDDNTPGLPNTATINNLVGGTSTGTVIYTVTETTVTGFDLTSLDCTVSTGGTSTVTKAPPKVTIGLKAGDTVTCKYTNKRWTLTLAPSQAANFVGDTHTLTATLVDSYGKPKSNMPVTFTVTGKNPGSGTVATNTNGVATWSYTGSNAGIDTIVATASVNGVLITSDPPASKTWTSKEGAAQAFFAKLGMHTAKETLYVSDNPLAANTLVNQWGSESARSKTSPLDSETYLLVYDPNSEGNWEHDVCYCFVKPDGTIDCPTMPDGITIDCCHQKDDGEYICCSEKSDGTLDCSHEAFTPPENVIVSKIAGVDPPRGGGTSGSSVLKASGTGTKSLGSTGGRKFLPMSVTSTVTTAATCDTSQLNCDNCWALLVSGGLNAGNNNARYYEDMSSMYTTLISLPYCYPKENIYVLMSDGTDPTADKITDGGGYLNSEPFGLVDGVHYQSATKANLVSRLGTLKQNLGSNSQLFIFTTNHGGLDPAGSGDVRLWLWNTQTPATEFIWAQEFVDALLPNSAQTIVMTMEQCNSGGFADKFIPSGYPGPQKRVIATAASSTGASYKDYFSKCWITGVKGDANNPPSGDSDKLVELWETKDYATRCDAAAKTIPPLEVPQYKTTAADGTTLSLSSCSRCADPKLLPNCGTITCQKPTDPDNDGIYEDVDGVKDDGVHYFTRTDVVLYFKNKEWISANEPICAFDTNGNGRIDFADVRNLYREGGF